MQSQADASRLSNSPRTGTDSGGQLITAAELSSTLDVSLRTIERWRKRGVGPPWVRIGPRAIRYDRTELALWWERNRLYRVST